MVCSLPSGGYQAAVYYLTPSINSGFTDRFFCFCFLLFDFCRRVRLYRCGDNIELSSYNSSTVCRVLLIRSVLFLFLFLRRVRCRLTPEDNATAYHRW